MKNNNSARKIKELRNRKGFSQEELSEKTGISLQTIQRIENGEEEPRGDSLKRLATVLEVSPDEIVDWTIQGKIDFLVYFNLSALSFMIFPIFGIVIPVIIWIYKKDKIQGLNELAKALLNYQITWTIFLFIGSVIMTSFLTFAFLKSGGAKADSSFARPIFSLLFIGVMYLFNLTIIIINSIRISKRKTAKYYPKIHFLK
jgi:transcriptional regulator with XRE-family HTH domain